MRGARAMRALALLGVTLAGCALIRSTPQVRYYTLALAGTPPTRLDAPVRIVAFTSDQPYATERMAFRSSPYRLDYYIYHRWAADPRNLISTAARDYFERATAAPGVPYEIEGNIRRLEEVDDPAGWKGALTLDVRVSRGGAVLLEHAYSDVEPAESRTPEAVAAALSRALQRVLDQLLADLTGRGSTPPGR